MDAIADRIRALMAETRRDAGDAASYRANP
jgi:hypothetical protein